MQDSKTRDGGYGRGRASLLFGSLAMLLVAGVALAEGEMRLKAKVTDASGKPVPDLEIGLVPEGDLPPRSMTTNGKGVATIPNLSPGNYRPSLVSDAYRVTSIAYTARASDGTRMPTFREDEVEDNGIPTIQMQPFSRGDMEITVGEVEAAASQDATGTLRGLEEAPGKLEVLNALFDVQEWDLLLEQSQAVLDEEPDNGGAHYLRGVALWKTGNHEEAERHVATAVTLLPDQPGIHGVLGALHLEHANVWKERGESDRAVELAEQAAAALERQIALTPDSKTDLTNLVIALETSGRNEQAMSALQRLIEVDPTDSRTYVRLAELQIEAGMAEEALGTLGSMPPSDTRVGDLFYNAGVVLWNENKLQETVAAMDRAIGLEPDNAMLHRLKGRVLVSLGETAAGIAELREYIRLSPPDANVEVELKLIEALEPQPDGG